MYQSGQPIGFWGAVFLGIGAMVGAGIFALLGEAGAIAGSGVWISFLIGGVIALLSGYSLARLGATFPAAGGIVEYLVQAWGRGTLSGSMSILLYIAAVISLSLISKAFGAYAASLLPDAWQHPVAILLSCLIVLVFMAVNLRGARDVTRVEAITVVIKFGVLVAMGIAGIAVMDPQRLSPSTYPQPSALFNALGVTFFAYEGFRVITNTAEDMPNPAKTLPRAMLAAILLVTALYVLVAIAVMGNLEVQQVIEAKEYALAAAAKPVFGEIGFVLVVLTALVSTASAINANLYAVTNVTFELARKGELPAAFGEPIAHSRKGLIYTSSLIVIINLLLDLTSIALLGSISILFVHAIVHFGHLRLTHLTRARWGWILAAGVASLCAAILATLYAADHRPELVWMLTAFFLVALGTEIFLQRVMGRVITERHSCRLEPPYGEPRDSR